MGGAVGGAAATGETIVGAAAAGETTVGATVVGGAAATVPPAGGGRGGEWRTQGRKALPPRVFTILKPEKGKKGEGAKETGNGM